MIQLDIPIRPLTANRGWYGRRFKSKEYKQFEKDIAMLVKRPSESLTGPLSVTIEAYFKNYKLSDIDNIAKVQIDVLQSMGFFKNDNQIQELHLYKYPCANKQERTKITIAEV